MFDVYSPDFPNLDGLAIRSPGDGIFFNNYIEDFAYIKASGLPHSMISGIDIGHSRGDENGRNGYTYTDPTLGDIYYPPYRDKIFKLERNIFDNFGESKLAGKFGTDVGNHLLFSNNVYWNSTWRAYHCNTEVIFAFESYYYSRVGYGSHSSLLNYGGCPRESTRIDPGNSDANLKSITRYNTHYYFFDIGAEDQIRVRPSSFISLNEDSLDNYKYVKLLAGDWVPAVLAKPEELIQADHNRYSSNLALNYYNPDDYLDNLDDCWVDPSDKTDPNTEKRYGNCMVEPGYWIRDNVSGTGVLTVAKEGGLSALEKFQQDHGQELNSTVAGQEDLLCVMPMLQARTSNPLYKSLDSDPNTCGDLKVAGSQTPLILDGFVYTYIFPFYIDDYQLFRRDFYGNTRFSQISVGAFQ